jgi:hypothetical protein
MTACIFCMHFRFLLTKQITMSNTPIYEAGAVEIADALQVTPRSVRMWAESGDLPRLARGTFDAGWATWLCAGRKVTARWGKKPSADVAVAAGWLQALGHEPGDDDLAALGNLFARNGKALAAAMLALGQAQAGLNR